MSDHSRFATNLPPEQEAIRAKCFHPSGTFVEFPIEDVETSIPARFEKIVRMYGDRLAAKVGKKSLTYDELNRHANRIARTILEKRGFGSEPIALFFENSIELVAAIFGVLKAGKFYVVLDPSFPFERLQFLLKDSGAKLVVTDQPNRDIALKVICEDQALITTGIDDEARSLDNINLHISSQELACIQYTSGSTGTPKGVVLLHRTILQSVRRMSGEFHVCVDDRFTLLHSLSFGSGHGNLRLALLNGSSIFGIDTKRANIERLASWLRDERITMYHSPVSLFRQLAESLPRGGVLPDLRLIRLSGAPISKRDFDLYKTRFGSNTLLRIVMGSSEGRGICGAILNQGFSYPAEGFPIGYPLEKTILFLDDDRRQVPPGQIGEIAVQSENLSVGYWKQPNATNDKFLPDPDGGDEKIYLTGDLGRMLPDGFVVHLGRKDLMVKIRGFRVDFSEIERALVEHPEINEVGVRAWDREDGEKYLAAYIVPRPESQLNVSEIRQFLSGKLPDYMNPTVVQFVEALPLTNGKLDRQALPKPDTLRPVLKETYVGPRNETEKKLAGIWSEVLQIDDIGVHDDFFDLGGHSLAASRILSRVLDCFCVELSFASFFESLTISALARTVDVLHKASSEMPSSLVPVSRANTLPASFGQRGLWFHEQLEPGSPAYNLPSVYRLSGELDPQLLEMSINQIIARHEVLRTVFETVEAQPVQKILPKMMIGLEESDLTGLASDALQDSKVRRFVGVFAERSFDLTRGPLLRAALLKLASNEHVLLLAIHHIVFDGWSIGIFFRELSHIYNNFKSGKSCPLPELGIQYADFAKWQRERLHDAKLKSSLKYWKTQLDNLPTLTLPTKRTQNISEPSSRGREEFELSRELLDGLQGLAHLSGTTLFMVLLAAWKITLCRYTGQTDIAIGTPVAGRNHPAVEDLIGYFLNLVVLRSDLSGDPTVRELLERIRRVCVDAFAHQDVPFEKLVEELRPTRHVAANPLVQATFALQNTPKQLLNLTGIGAQDLNISSGVVRPFDLHLYMVEQGSCIRGYLCYNTSLFEADAIKMLVTHLQNLLESIVKNQDRRITGLPMLTESEKRQLLVNSNHCTETFPKSKCLHRLFEDQVEQTGDAVAVVYEGEELTYRELNRRANRLAHRLRGLGVGPDVLVGLCVERSIELIIGVLGILKAGGAYVPFDPSYPRDRLEFMLKDSAVSVLLAQKHLAANLRDQSSVVLYLDEDQAEQFPCDAAYEANLESNAKLDNLAYVIYTSGSTGQPKGVLVTHHNVVRLFHSTQARFDFNGFDVWTLFHSYAFDFSVWEIWGALLHGGRLIVVPDSVRRSPDELAVLIEENRVTVLNQTPSAFQQLMPHLISSAGSDKLALRYVIFGGETLEPQRLRPWLHRYGDQTPKLINMYGITETTVHVTYRPIARVDIESKAGNIIGVPIPDVELYVLDSYRNLVPIGVPGELYVGGAGLAKGYLNRADLTAERFVDHPFAKGRKLYRSGDLVRRRADGDIEYVGRIDNQVKICGYRIELGEIEVVLGQHPMVQSSVVVVREDTPGDKRLVGYVIGRQEDSLDVAEIRTYLKQKLPEYMIPFQFVLLDALPLTPNGKVDRKALSVPGEDRPELGNSYQAPRTPTEETLVAIWGKVLKLDKVGIYDNFFDLGGHSLLATQVMSRIRSAFSIDLPLRYMFESPTVAELAAIITQTQWKQASEPELAQIMREVAATTEEDAQKMITT